MKESKNQASGRPERVVIKKYANRRLYNTECSSYVTLGDIAEMVRNGRDFVVQDSKTGDDLTHSVLTQIIVEQESKSGGPTLLSIPFLRQLICYYDDAIGKIVPSYLQISMAVLAKEQERYRDQLTNREANAFEIYQEQAHKNLAMFENAFVMWALNSNFEQNDKMQVNDADGAYLSACGKEHVSNGYNFSLHASECTEAATKNRAKSNDRHDKMYEINLLKEELAEMQERINRIVKSG